MNGIVVLIFLFATALLEIKGILTGGDMHSPETKWAYLLLAATTAVGYGVYLYIRYSRNWKKKN